MLYEKAKKDIQKSYLRFESKADIKKAILIQEKISGVEYGLDIFNDLNGEYIKTTVKRKLAMRSGETDIAKVTDDESLQAIGKRIGQNLCHIGNLDLAEATLSHIVQVSMNLRRLSDFAAAKSLMT